MKKILLKTMFVAVMMTACTFSAKGGDGFSRGHGVIARIGAGVPANFEAGIGYRFCPQFELAAEAFSYSGLTAMTGALDARCHILDRSFTPYVDAKIGYGTLGVDIENQNYNNFHGSITAGLSWRRFDLGAGAVFDPFHKVEFISALSWTFCFGE